MRSLLTLQFISSFVVGGLFIALQTLLAERVPLKWRGAVLTVPSTSAISFLFIGLTKSAADIPAVARMFPAALAPCYVFVLVFATLSVYSATWAFFGGYAVWAFFAYFLIAYPPVTFVSSVCIYALPLVALTYFLVKRLPQQTKLVPVPMSAKHIFVRALFGGSVVFTAVFMSKKLGNVWGGLFSGFPAGFSATLLIYYFVHGKKIIPSIAKSLYFPGVLGFIIYAGAASLAFPRWGIWWGTVVSYVAVAVFYQVNNTLSSKT